ncbi:uroporphyrinogen-III synthase [Edaphosphingomonas haloaromaticamans]|uniref:Uroporphyrinogen-III synthase n=1 Tax=Edaphosphingomonas haloaromaticamans TaxID=653954 RepID=A0A1S1HAD4_9SPHN|nr:uroporphyrinogen-III synthase [Sphingomonas haloaromaticamans]OHT18421.1 uroporphyrinogen-III synthase [Sphingomonas haloaromaticamans]
MRRVLILRPEPGASATAARAAALGLEAVVAPLFVTRPLPWQPPPADRFDAVMLTSAAAARLGGDGLAAYRALPAFAVGAATADAARAAGFADIQAGDADAPALLERIAAAGHRRLLHLAGREHRAAAHPAIAIDRAIVYAADAVEALPRPARAALAEGAVALLHSPRAARHFAGLVDRTAGIGIAAISPAVAEAAGKGWAAIGIADHPDDAALLAVAAALCDQADRLRNG